MQACVNEVSDGCLATSKETFEKISRVLGRNRTFDDAMEVVDSIPSWNWNSFPQFLYTMSSNNNLKPFAKCLHRSDCHNTWLFSQQYLTEKTQKPNRLQMRLQRQAFRHRAVFQWASKVITQLLASRQFSKPIAIARNSDWFIVLPTPVVISRSN